MAEYISRGDAAARMFGTGSPQHKKALELDAKGAKPLPVASVEKSVAASAARQDVTRELEDRLVALAAGDWLDSIDELRAILAMGGPGIRAAVLAMVPPQVEALALVGIADAVDLGVESASETIGRTFKPKDEKAAARVAMRAGRAAEALSGTDAVIAEAVKRARRLATGGADDVAILAPLSAARNDVKSRLVWAANRAANDGVIAAGKRAKVPLVWVAERDACAKACLRLSGQVVEPGDEYDWSATYADHPLGKPPGKLDAPPRHPYCRCHLEALNHPSYAEALRREADRSILRGYSLPSESMTARVRAAELLLDEGVDAPKTVKADAASAVKAGTFPGRKVPNG